MADIFTDNLIVNGKWGLVGGYSTVITRNGHPVYYDSHSSAQRLDELLPDRQQVGHLEFFWDDSQRRHGVIAVDARGEVIVHIMGALLGYNGSGPKLSEAILRYLGVLDEVFSKAQEATWESRPYVLVVHRTGPNSWDWERIK